MGRDVVNRSTSASVASVNRPQALVDVEVDFFGEPGLALEEGDARGRRVGFGAFIVAETSSCWLFSWQEFFDGSCLWPSATPSGE